jgi:hypothetical protein
MKSALQGEKRALKFQKFIFLRNTKFLTGHLEHGNSHKNYIVYLLISEGHWRSIDRIKATVFAPTNPYCVGKVSVRDTPY